MRSEKDLRLRIDLLEGQSGSIARVLAKAMQEHNEEAVRHYSEKLAIFKSRVDELMWVLGIKAGLGVLDTRVYVDPKSELITIRSVIEKMKDGQLKMDDLPSDVQALVRKGALEIKNAFKNTL